MPANEAVRIVRERNDLEWRDQRAQLKEAKKEEQQERLRAKQAENQAILDKYAAIQKAKEENLKATKETIKQIKEAAKAALERLSKQEPPYQNGHTTRWISMPWVKGALWEFQTDKKYIYSFSHKGVIQRRKNRAWPIFRSYILHRVWLRSLSLEKLKSLKNAIDKIAA